MRDTPLSNVVDVGVDVETGCRKRVKALDKTTSFEGSRTLIRLVGDLRHRE